MMLTNAPIITQIPVIDFNRAVRFYQDTLGLNPAMVMNEQGLAMFESAAGRI